MARDAYLHLRDVPATSPLQVLALFSILESLLTHQPDKNDPSDSTTRQIKNKMVLLDSRFREVLPYVEYFGDKLTRLQTWTKLYEVRSAVAHGRQPEAKGFEDLEKVRRFMRLAVKRVMRHALDNPRLSADLREC